MQVLPSDAFDPAEARAPPRRAARAAGRGDRARRAQARQRAVRRARARGGGGGGAAQARGVPRGAAPRWGPNDLPRGRGVPALPRAVRDALRPRPDAPADDGARPAAAPLRLDPRGRDQRQVLDRALLRRDPRAPRAAHRQLHLAAPALVPGADRGGGGAGVGGRLRGCRGARRAGRRARQPHRGAGRPRYAVRGAHRRGLPRAGAARGGGGGDRGRPGRALRRDQRDPVKVQALTSVGLEHTRWLGPTSPTSPRRSSRWCATTARSWSGRSTRRPRRSRSGSPPSVTPR